MTSISQRNLATCLLAGGVIFVLLGQITQVALPDGERTPAFIAMACGLLFYLFGIVIARQPAAYERVEAFFERAFRRFELQAWRLFALIMAALLAILAHYAAGELETMVSPVAGWLAWFGAVIFGFTGLWRYSPFNLRAHGKTLAAVIGFTILGLLFRSGETDRIPIILYGDEASAGIFAGSILDGRFNNPFTAGWYSFPGLYFYIPAFSISILGYTSAALRIPSAIAGALTVGGAYLTGRILFDKRTGVIAALILAGFHFHIHFSRIGLNNIWDGLFFTLTVGAAWYAWDRENRNAYVLTGLGLGLAQYFYPSSRALAALVLGGIIVSGFFDVQKLKRAVPHLALAFVMAAIVFLPMAWYYIRHPEQYFAPMERVSILGEWLTNTMAATGLPAWRILLNQLLLGAQSFTYLPLQHWYQPEVALLRPLPAGLFLLGLIFLASRPKDSRAIFIFIWTAMYILLGGLSESTPAAQRYVAAAPLCILVIAVGVNETLELIGKLWVAPPRAIGLAAVTLAALIAASDAHFYFNAYTPKSVLMLDGTNGDVAQRIANDMLNKPEGTQAFFFGDGGMGYFSIPSLPYLAHQVEGYDVPFSWGAPENPVPTSNHLAFIFLPQNAADLPVIQAAYPGGALLERHAQNGNLIYLLYEYDASP